MESFFDTNIIFKYSLWNSGSKDLLLKKCFDSINIKEGKFIICYRVLRELEDIRKRYSSIYSDVLRKIKESDYELGSSAYVQNLWFFRRDLPMAKRIYLKHKDRLFEDVSDDFDKLIAQMNFRIDRFKKVLVDFIVIPEEDINDRFVSWLKESIDNHSDCEILSSAIDFQQERDLFFFVTADRHFDENGYDFIKEDYRFEKLKFPVLKNLLSD